MQALKVTTYVTANVSMICVAYLALKLAGLPV
jgi:hypothetical protein